eukprot:TRINITY_DN4650_c0_g1_i6.p1 TRINITY_DN4650_c0_g1~~TRINITY_DN4650_c0_g1_i6.p1  ORF type:complete len:142 (-),score=36.52 TRINITY_DN4650_c0_g1_i6:1388-1789(-)
MAEAVPLSEDVVRCAMSLLEERDLLAASGVCALWRRLAQPLWEQLFARGKSGKPISACTLAEDAQVPVLGEDTDWKALMLRCTHHDTVGNAMIVHRVRQSLFIRGAHRAVRFTAKHKLLAIIGSDFDPRSRLC